MTVLKSYIWHPWVAEYREIVEECNEDEARQACKEEELGYESMSFDITESSFECLKTKLLADFDAYGGVVFELNQADVRCACEEEGVHFQSLLGETPTVEER